MSTGAATATRPDRGRKRISAGNKAMLAAALLVPIVIAAGRWHGAPTAHFLTGNVSLRHLSPALQGTVDGILFVPIGALLVVVFRLTLGIRVLGPFRSVLLALAFLATGIWLGLAFMLLAVSVVVLLRRPIKGFRLPYFGRITVMLSTVVLIMIAGTLAGVWLGSASLRQVAHFPVVVLCLIAEAVAVAIRREGLGSGLWRAGTTATLAVIVAAIGLIPNVRAALLGYPELILLEIALIILISRYGAWRLLKGLNPAPAAKARAKPAAAAKTTTARAARAPSPAPAPARAARTAWAARPSRVRRREARPGAGVRASVRR